MGQEQMMMVRKKKKRKSREELEGSEEVERMLRHVCDSICRISRYLCSGNRQSLLERDQSRLDQRIWRIRGQSEQLTIEQRENTHRRAIHLTQ